MEASEPHPNQEMITILSKIFLAVLIAGIFYATLHDGPLSEDGKPPQEEEEQVESKPKKAKKAKKTAESKKEVKKEEPKAVKTKTVKKEEPKAAAKSKAAKKEQPKKEEPVKQEKKAPTTVVKEDSQPFISKSQAVDMPFEEVKQRVKKETSGKRRFDSDSDFEYESDDEDYWADNKKGDAAKQKKIEKQNEQAAQELKKKQQMEKSSKLKQKKEEKKHQVEEASLKKTQFLKEAKSSHRPPTTSFDIDQAQEAKSEYDDDEDVVIDADAGDMVLEQNSYQQAKAEAADIAKTEAAKERANKNKEKKKRKKENKAAATQAASAIVETTASKPKVQKNLTASVTVDSFVTVNKREKIGSKKIVEDSSDYGDESELSMD